MILPLRVFGRELVKRISSGCAKAPISWRTCFLSSSRSCRWVAATESHEHGNRFAFRSSGRPTAAASATSGCEREHFNFDRAQAMSRNIDHIIDASHDPVVSIVIVPALSPARYMPGTFDQYTSLKRSSSPQMPRNMPGQGCVITSQPPWFFADWLCAPRSPEKSPAAAWCNFRVSSQSRPAADSS